MTRRKKYEQERYRHGDYWLRVFLWEERSSWYLEFRRGQNRKYQSLKTDDREQALDEFYRRKLDLQRQGYFPELVGVDLTEQIDAFLDWSEVRTVTV